MSWRESWRAELDREDRRDRWVERFMWMAIGSVFGSTFTAVLLLWQLGL